ncbi:transcription initiation protein [Nocardioides sp. KIGAM211]|uniref:Transcription initiation protein n=1 Tax=Nocardioides luti TaxID=2761101 RepID=A0A7X0RJX0_9ACTN|nr:YciI family protein [Nocardioides luti]MBB6628640.1 transcription initiation protein [Nocardioides luti]
MRILVLLTEDDPAAWERASDEERAAVFEHHYAFDRAVRERGELLAGEALAGVETARTLRTVGGERVVTDGPYAQTVEQLGGFYLIDVPDLDAAVELCRVLPAGYTIEVRAAVDMEDYDPGR